jgi:hypothetical protein
LLLLNATKQITVPRLARPQIFLLGMRPNNPFFQKLIHINFSFSFYPAIYFTTLLPLNNFNLMTKNKSDYSFWSQYKQFAGNELMLYAIMIIGIILGIIIFS